MKAKKSRKLPPSLRKPRPKPVKEKPDIRLLYSNHRSKLSPRAAAYAVARDTGLSIDDVCKELGLTAAYIKDVPA